MAHERVIGVEATSAEAAVRSKGDLARLQEYLDTSRQLTAAAEIYLSYLHWEFIVVTAKMRDIELAKTTWRKNLDTSSVTHTKMETVLTTNLCKTICFTYFIVESCAMGRIQWPLLYTTLLE